MGQLLERAKALVQRIDLTGYTPAERRILEEAGVRPNAMVAVDRAKRALAPSGGGTVVGIWVGPTPSFGEDCNDARHSKAVFEVEAASEVLALLVPDGWETESWVDRLTQLGKGCETSNGLEVKCRRGQAAAIRLALSVVTDGKDSSS